MSPEISHATRSFRQMLVFNDPSTCDFAFVAEGKEVLVHRQVILAQSPFFRDFLKEDPSCTRINANNALFDAMVAVMSSLYQLELLSQLEDSNSSRSTFPVVLSAWEISSHFQLSRQSAVLLPILLRRIDRSNVVRALKAALKQLQAPGRQRGLDEGAMKLRDACLAHLPPLISTAQQQQEWQELVAKYRWLAQSSNVLPTAPVSAPPPAAALVTSDSSQQSPPAPTALLMHQINEAVRTARSTIDEVRNMRVSAGVGSISTLDTSTESRQSVTRQSSTTSAVDFPGESEQTGSPADELELQKWQEQWNETVAAATAARQRRANEEAALRRQLEQALVDDVSVVEMQEQLDLVQQQILEIQQQEAQVRKVVESLEKDISEGQAYTASTQIYIPAATAAKVELQERISRTRAWLESQPQQSPQTPVTLRRSLAGFATELRDMKSQAQRDASMEENKIATLTRQIAAQIDLISTLGQALNDLH